MAFFQRPTDYPCQLILDPQNDYETLRRRVEQTTLKAQTVNRNRSGVTNVSYCVSLCALSFCPLLTIDLVVQKGATSWFGSQNWSVPVCISRTKFFFIIFWTKDDSCSSRSVHLESLWTFIHLTSMRCCPMAVKHTGRWWRGSSSSMPNSTLGSPTYRAWMRSLGQSTTHLPQTPTASGKVCNFGTDTLKVTYVYLQCLWFLTASLYRARWSRHLLLFHQPNVRE